MSVRSRQTKVFAALLVSIAVGAIILKTLGNNPPSAGAFCLSRYYHLDPVEKSILSQATQYPGRWSHIEIYYSVTKSAKGGHDQGRRCWPGNAITWGPNRRILGNRRESRIQNRESRCHFVICNGRIGHDGQILPTEDWQRQRSPHQLHQSGLAQTGGRRRCIGGGQLVLGKTPTHRSEQTIYIGVIADDEAIRPTDFQIRRTEALVEGLSRKFNIRPESIHYPDNWQ